MNTEDHNLGIYRILYIIKGVFTLLFSLLPLIYISIASFVFNNAELPEDQAHLGTMLMMTLGIVVFLFLLALGILTLLTAKYLGEKRNYDFIFVMAIVNCLTGILGIILGIFTILELNKPHVKRLFGKTA
jgi:putative copper export protein